MAATRSTTKTLKQASFQLKQTPSALQKARDKEFRRLFYPDMLPPLSFFLNPPPLFRQ